MIQLPKRKEHKALIKGTQAPDDEQYRYIYIDNDKRESGVSDEDAIRMMEEMLNDPRRKPFHNEIQDDIDFLKENGYRRLDNEKALAFFKKKEKEIKSCLAIAEDDRYRMVIPSIKTSELIQKRVQLLFNISVIKECTKKDKYDLYILCQGEDYENCYLAWLKKGKRENTEAA